MSLYIRELILSQSATVSVYVRSTKVKKGAQMSTTRSDGVVIAKCMGGVQSSACMSVCFEGLYLVMGQ